MQHQFKFGTTSIPYTLIRSAEADVIKISVEFEYGMEVVAPMDVSEDTIEKVLRKKSHWIIEKLETVKAVESTPSQREFVSGEKFLYLGRLYKLIVYERAERRPFLVMRNSTFEASVLPDMKIWDQHQAIHDLFEEWYKQQAQKRLPEQVNIYSKTLNLHPTDIRITSIEHRWGSCSASGIVQLNWRLVMAPINIIDYVVVHELCHQVIMDHSPRFWAMVAAIVPDYEQRRQWLRLNGPTLIV